MSAVIFWASPDFEKNCYSRTASYIEDYYDTTICLLKTKNYGSCSGLPFVCFLSAVLRARAKKT